MGQVTSPAACQTQVGVGVIVGVAVGGMAVGVKVMVGSSVAVEVGVGVGARKGNAPQAAAATASNTNSRLLRKFKKKSLIIYGVYGQNEPALSGCGVGQVPATNCWMMSRN